MLKRPVLVAAVLVLLAGATVMKGANAGLTSRDGRIAYVHLAYGGYQIYAVSPAGAQRHRLTSSRRTNSFEPSFAPGGRRIAFVRATNQAELWTMSADSTHKQRLTFSTGRDEVDPAWSPDGKHIAFAVDEHPGQGIWIMRPDGKGRVRLTSSADRQPAWSPDESEIAFQHFDVATVTDSILVMPSAGGATTTLAGEPGVSDLDPAWSPDGSSILFASDRPDTSQLDLWLMNADGSNVRRVTDTPNRDERDPAWSPDGRRIAYSGNGYFHGRSSSLLYVSNADGSNRRIVSHTCADCFEVTEAPSWQPVP